MELIPNKHYQLINKRNSVIEQILFITVNNDRIFYLLENSLNGNVQVISQQLTEIKSISMGTLTDLERFKNLLKIHNDFQEYKKVILLFNSVKQEKTFINLNQFKLLLELSYTELERTLDILTSLYDRRYETLQLIVFFKHNNINYLNFTSDMLYKLSESVDIFRNIYNLTITKLSEFLTNNNLTIENYFQLPRKIMENQLISLNSIYFPNDSQNDFHEPTKYSETMLDVQANNIYEELLSICSKLLIIQEQFGDYMDLNLKYNYILFYLSTDAINDFIILNDEEKQDISNDYLYLVENNVVGNDNIESLLFILEKTQEHKTFVQENKFIFNSSDYINPYVDNDEDVQEDSPFDIIPLLEEDEEDVDYSMSKDSSFWYSESDNRLRTPQFGGNDNASW